MRMANGWGVAVVALLAVVVGRITSHESAWGNGSQSTAGAEAPLMMTTVAAVNNGQHIVVVDAQERVIGTYQVDPATGALSLKSVRNIRWDLKMSEFNGSDPKPNEIRRLLEQN